mmetsp:Transcript_78426/g.224730  ORF Transcript_78426/g.224730 Transcript_78426/m.224730 type:complete len:259 (-) Transcript_78426:394-1170(-)
MMEFKLSFAGFSLPFMKRPSELPTRFMRRLSDELAAACPLNSHEASPAPEMRVDRPMGAGGRTPSAAPGHLIPLDPAESMLLPTPMLPVLECRLKPLLCCGEAVGDCSIGPQSEEAADGETPSDILSGGPSLKTRRFLRLWLLGDASRTPPPGDASPTTFRDEEALDRPCWTSSGPRGNPGPAPLLARPSGEPCTCRLDGESAMSSPGLGDCPRRSREAARIALPAMCGICSCSAAVAPKATSLGFGASRRAAWINFL